MKHQSGFVPVKFNSLGTALVVVGGVGIIERILNYFFNWYTSGSMFTYFSIVMVLVGMYMKKYNPKEK
jgi:hypothetical protein